jgi:hypothetical protein
MLKLGALLVAAAFILLIWAIARPVPARVQVTFMGFTNLHMADATTSGALPITFAYFCVSNAGNCSVIDRVTYGPEFKAGLQIETHTGGMVAARTRWRRYGPHLKPGEFKTIWSIPPEGNAEPWRISLKFSRIDWQYQLAQKPPRALRAIMKFIPQKWLENRQWDVYSDWVHGPQLVPVVTNKVTTHRENLF